MYRDSPFDFPTITASRLDVSERLLVKDIFEKYLSNKIFYQQITNSDSDRKKFRKLERNFNLRACLLHFYCNPLYKQSFNRNTIQNLHERLKRQELSFLHQHPDAETTKKYFAKDAWLPVFLLYGEQKIEQPPIDLNILYKEIIEKEHTTEKGIPYQKFLKFFTLLSFIIRLPLVRIIRSIKFRNKITTRIRHIENIYNLWKTVNVLSFQLNFLVFRKGIREIITGRSEIVDLSILVMLIGDDFIDQIARNKGSEKIFNLISRKKEAFEIKINADYTLQSNDLVSLYKSLHIEDEKVSDIVDLTFEELYLVMIEIFSEINSRLLKISLVKRKSTCEAISRFLNYCLSTYMDDLLFSISETEKKYSLKDTNWYFYKKNNCVMMYGLWLRAQLMDLNYEKFLPQIKEWGSLVENIQIYDDLKDMKVDWNYQPNYPLILSFEYFYDEYLWFEQNQHFFTDGCKNDEIVELSIAMPKTVAHAMMLSKSMGISNLKWFTKFATNYCWKQNWTKAFLPFSDYKVFNTQNLSNHKVFDKTRNKPTTGSKETDLVFQLLLHTHSLFSLFENKDFYFDYLLMLCLNDRNFSRRFYRRTNLFHTYNLIFRFQFMKTGHRTRLMNRFMKMREKSVESALKHYQEHELIDCCKLPAELTEYISTNWIK